MDVVRCDCGARCVCGECCDYPFIDYAHPPEECPIFPCYHKLLDPNEDVDRKEER